MNAELWRQTAERLLHIGFRAAASEACHVVADELELEVRTCMEWIRTEPVARIPREPGVGPVRHELLQRAVALYRDTPEVPEQTAHERGDIEIPEPTGDDRRRFSRAVLNGLVEARVLALALQQKSRRADRFSTVGYPRWLDELAGTQHRFRRLVPDEGLRDDDPKKNGLSTFRYRIAWSGDTLEIFVTNLRRVLGYATTQVPTRAPTRVIGRLMRASGDDGPGLAVQRPEMVLPVFGLAGGGLPVASLDR